MSVLSTIPEAGPASFVATAIATEMAVEIGHLKGEFESDVYTAPRELRDY